MSRTVLLLAAAALFTADLSAGNGQGHPPGATGGAIAAPAQRQEFLENKGHLPSQVLYRADFGMLALFAERDRFTWSMLQPDAGERVHAYLHDNVPFDLHGHAWQMELVGASPSVTVTAKDRSSASFNFFLGNHPSEWSTDARAYGEVHYGHVWEGIGLVLKTSEGAFKYDLLLDGGAEVEQVRFAYTGLESLDLREDGRLVLRTSVGELFEMAPVAAYANGAQEKIHCRFVVDGNTVGFRFGVDVDTDRPIVIDPLLIASTLSGTGNIGTTENYGFAATYDDAGNIYTGAICFGQGYPVNVGAFDLLFNGLLDIVVSKLNPDGSDLIYATYIGGDDEESPHSLVVTPNNELTVFGSTQSLDYPVTAGAFQPAYGGGTDIVVTKLTADGTALVGSTYLGGAAMDGPNVFTTNYGDDARGEAIADANGNILVASCSRGAGFPTTPGAYQPAFNGGDSDGVLFSLSPDLSVLNWGTYLGTPDDEVCLGLKLTSTGDVVAAGSTDSQAFPTTAGAYQQLGGAGHDGFVAHFSGGVSTLLHSTYFGGSGNDDAFFVQVDDHDAVYLYGQTDPGSIAIAPVGTYGVAGGDVFIAKFDAALSTTIFTTTIGTGGLASNVAPIAFQVDVCGRIYISGHGQLNGVGVGMPVSADAFQSNGGLYLAVFDVEMTGLLFGTYYGSIGDHVDGATSRFDPAGRVYQAVCTGGGFPTTPWAWSNVQPVGWDIGVFKMDFEQASVQVNVQDPGPTCAWVPHDLFATGNALSYEWDLGDGSPTAVGSSVNHTYSAPGVYTIRLIGYDSTACNGADTTYFNLLVDICAGVDPDPVQPDAARVWFDGSAITIMPADGSSAGAWIEVSAVSGALLRRQWVSFTEGLGRLPFHDVAPGVYLVRSTTVPLAGRIVVPVRY